MKDFVLNNQSVWLDMTSSERESVYSAESCTNIYKFIYVKKGEITAVSNATELTLTVGEMLFLPPTSPFKILLKQGEAPTEIYRMSFRFFPNVDNYEYKMQAFKLPHKTVEYLEEFRTFDRNLVDSEYIWKAYRLLAEFEKLLKKKQDASALKLEKALDYMRDNDNYSVPQLAKMCNMSRSAFYDLFQRVVGATPIQTKHRLQAYKAEILLRTTDMSVDEIAERVGFQSTAHFRKVFYNRYHCSPSEIRKKTKDSRRE